MTPKILQSDLGLEFRGEVSAWCDEHEIKQVFSKSHSPQAQGLVEGINKLLRMKLQVCCRTRYQVEYLTAALTKNTLLQVLLSRIPKNNLAALGVHVTRNEFLGKYGLTRKDRARWGDIINVAINEEGKDILEEEYTGLSEEKLRQQPFYKACPQSLAVK